jgi:hypothetical protein
MNRCYTFSRRRFIQCPPRHLAVEDLLTQLLWCYTPAVRRIIRCWRTSRQNVFVCFFVTVGWTDASSDHGIGSSGAEGFVLAHFYLDSNEASDRPTVSSLRPSDHPVLLSSPLFLCNSSGASRNLTIGSTDGVIFILPPSQCTNYTNAKHRWCRRFIRWCLFFASSTWIFTWT